MGSQLASSEYNWTSILVTTIKAVIMFAIMATALLGNFLVIVSVLKNRKLRSLTNYFIVSLAMADMLVALGAMGFNASVELMGYWMFGSVMCDVWNSLDVYFSTVSILHLCCISVDRHFAVFRPLEYRLIMTRKTVIKMLVLAWSIPAFVSFLPIFLGWYTTNEHLEHRAKHPEECGFIVNSVYAVISGIVSFWAPGTIMMVVYWRIYREAKRQEEEIYQRMKAYGVVKRKRTRKEKCIRFLHKIFPICRICCKVPEDNDELDDIDSDSLDENDDNDVDLGTPLELEGDSKPGLLAKPGSDKKSEEDTRREHDSEPPEDTTRQHDTKPKQFLSEVEQCPNLQLNPEEEGEHQKSPGEEGEHQKRPGEEGEHRQSPEEEGKDEQGTDPQQHSETQQNTEHAESTEPEQRGEAEQNIETQPSTEPQQQDGNAEPQATKPPKAIVAAGKEMKRQRKAARTLGIIMTTFVLCWLPFFVWYTLSALCGVEKCFRDDLFVLIAFWVGYLNSALNPIIYAYYNREFRAAFKTTIRDSWVGAILRRCGLMEDIYRDLPPKRRRAKLVMPKPGSETHSKKTEENLAVTKTSSELHLDKAEQNVEEPGNTLQDHAIDLIAEDSLQERSPNLDGVLYETITSRKMSPGRASAVSHVGESPKRESPIQTIEKLITVAQVHVVKTDPRGEEQVDEIELDAQVQSVQRQMTEVHIVETDPRGEEHIDKIELDAQVQTVQRQTTEVHVFETDPRGEEQVDEIELETQVQTVQRQTTEVHVETDSPDGEHIDEIKRGSPIQDTERSVPTADVHLVQMELHAEDDEADFKHDSPIRTIGELATAADVHAVQMELHAEDDEADFKHDSPIRTIEELATAADVHAVRIEHDGEEDEDQPREPRI